MTVVSNDPNWWPTINYVRVDSYFSVVSFVVVLYDWALTFGQEFELVWRQRWSLMTALYLIVRYIGIPFTVINVLQVLPSVSSTNAGCLINEVFSNWMSFVTNFMMGVIVTIRLHAMYQRSRKMLIFLCGIFLTVQIACVVMGAVETMGLSGVEYVLSGVHMCSYEINNTILGPITWILGTIWEFLTLCLAVWIAVKHFRELRQASTGGAVEDCFTVLIETHVFYFACFVIVSALKLSLLSPKILISTSLVTDIFQSFLLVAQVVQMFVLGPRLILGVREFHAKLVANSDEATGVASIVFQDRVHISTGGGV